jgi:DNA polymerase zeta
VLRLRVPRVPPPQLSRWFEAGPPGGRWRCLRSIALRARLSLALLDQLDLVGRTGEMARCFGIDFSAGARFPAGPPALPAPSLV